jgi:hypothetical protein
VPPKTFAEDSDTSKTVAASQLPVIEEEKKEMEETK